METFNFNSLNLNKIKKVIDVGCGNGRHLKSLGFKLTDAEIIGIDQSVLEITKLNEEFSDSSCKNHNIYRFINGDIRNKKLLKKYLNWADLVVWMAALVGDGACSINPKITFDINSKSVKFLANFTLSITASCTSSASICNLYFICNGLVDINV